MEPAFVASPLGFLLSAPVSSCQLWKTELCGDDSWEEAHAHSNAGAFALM